MAMKLQELISFTPIDERTAPEAASEKNKGKTWD
jgi:hypothetical protein